MWRGDGGTGAHISGATRSATVLSFYKCRLSDGPKYSRFHAVFYFFIFLGNFDKIIILFVQFKTSFSDQAKNC